MTNHVGKSSKPTIDISSGTLLPAPRTAWYAPTAMKLLAASSAGVAGQRQHLPRHLVSANLSEWAVEDDLGLRPEPRSASAAR